MTDTDRQYPIPAPDDDGRFTFGLILEVADVLAAHGYPKVTSGDDFVELQQVLFRFLYSSAPTPGAATDPAGLDPASEEC